MKKYVIIPKLSAEIEPVDWINDLQNDDEIIFLALAATLRCAIVKMSEVKAKQLQKKYEEDLHVEEDIELTIC